MGTEQAVAFGAVLRHRRQAAGLTQQALAERAGLSVDAISALEAGRRGGVRLETARRLAEGLALTDEDRAQFLAAARPGEPVAADMAVLSPSPPAARSAAPPAAAGPAPRLAGIHALPRERG